MTEQTDEYWMQQALRCAKKAEALGEVPVGAVVVRDNQLLAEGWNQPITAHDPTAHAEIMAIRAAGKQAENYRLPGATLYVSIEPCTMCAGAIVHSRISRVVFAATEPKAGAVISNNRVFDGEELNHRVAYQGGVCAEAATAMIQAFFKRRRAEQKAARKALRSSEDENG
ncbi:MAG: tRNA adenosine(34) deaminase TadA [Candidatus Pelagadaptatus aseana]|uniref:tRNA adenosine(34) deaminase TadA n=1 Tax=Candidatus Pelagadaptatus aseana TaxID=3120508 RepID=UPI0039B2A074